MSILIWAIFAIACVTGVVLCLVVRELYLLGGDIRELADRSERKDGRA